MISVEQTDIIQTKNDSKLEDNHFILNNQAVLLGCKCVCNYIAVREWDIEREKEIDWEIEKMQR